MEGATKSMKTNSTSNTSGNDSGRRKKPKRIGVVARTKEAKKLLNVLNHFAIPNQQKAHAHAVDSYNKPAIKSSSMLASSANL